jgi:NADH-quinone oxidoreductase subunit C
MVAEPEVLHGAPVLTSSVGHPVVFPSPHAYLDLLWKLRDEEHYEMCTDLCGVDRLTHPHRTLPADVSPERFEVVLQLLSLSKPARLGVRVQVPADDLVIPSAYDVYPSVDAMEREAYDMFGIRFEGHPDLSRILMPEDWDGHPLRKDFSVGRIPVQFKAPQGRGATT